MKTKDTEAVQALQQNLTEQGYDIQEVDAGNLPETGLMQTRSDYSTAVKVVNKRDLNQVESRCLAEAARGGEEFYYSWSQGGSIIEGLTVGAAEMIVRNWGNCAVNVKVQETHNSYIFYAAFIDFETGFNIVRPFKMSKQSPKKRDGRDIYTGERASDIIFQIGTSKATRNVVLNAVPKWLSKKVLDLSKQNIIGQIKEMGPEKAKEKVLKKIESMKIPIDRVESNYGKVKSWDIDKVVAVMGALRSIEDGIESVEEVFGAVVNVTGEEPQIKGTEGKASTKNEKPEAKSEKGKKAEKNSPLDGYMKELKKLMTEEEIDNWEVKNNSDFMNNLNEEDQARLADEILGHKSFVREVNKSDQKLKK